MSQTLAEIAYSKIEPDRKAMLSTLAAKATKLTGAERLNQNVEDLIAYSNATGKDVVSRMLDSVAGQVHDAATAVYDSFSDCDLSKLFVGATNEDDVTAHLAPFSDGSGLILVSDGIIGLVTHMSQLVARILLPEKPGLIRMIRHSQRINEEPEPEDVELMAGALRYYHVHQRYFGNSGKLALVLGDRGADVAAVLNLVALRFIVAHETAHFMLGHTAAPSTRMASDQLAACDDSHDIELAADRLGIDISLAAERSATVRSSPDSDKMAILGASIAIWAIHATDRAEFVRRGVTHPPAEVRMEAIHRRLSHLGRDSIVKVLSSLARSVDISSDFSGPLPDSHWRRTYNSPHVDTTIHERTYYNTIPQLDKFQAGDRSRAGLLFEGAREICGFDMVAGFELAQAGQVLDALTAWGVNEEDLADIDARHQGLRFFTLQDIIYDGIRTTPQNSTIRRACAVVAATLVQDGLRK